MGSPRPKPNRLWIPLFLAITVVGLAALYQRYGLWLGMDAPPAGSPHMRLASTSEYRNTKPGVAYVGDEACAKCHATIAESYRQHPMGRSMGLAFEAVPKDTGKVLEVGDLAYSIERRDNKVYHREEQQGGKGGASKGVEAEVKYALGSGTHGISFLVEKGEGIYQSPLSWYTEKGVWDLAPGYSERNLHFGRRITVECLFCHTNQVQELPGRPPVFVGLSIGCERCHGPGELHARNPAVSAGKDKTIVNPVDLSPVALRESVCEQCHFQSSQRITMPGHSPFDFRPGLLFEDFVRVFTNPGDPLRFKNAVGQVEQMRQSRCYQKSKAQLGCISCHDPHRRPTDSEKADFYRKRCLECHASAGCSLDRTERLARSPEDSCIECHMPPAKVMDVAHTSRTLHNIPRHGREGVANPGAITPAHSASKSSPAVAP